jgi:protein-tyrosine phosphatase
MIDAIRNLGGRWLAMSYFGHTLLGSLGFYRRDRDVDWSRVRRLVFVCSGNICRSPYGEELARMRGIPAISFGLHANGTAPADPSASRVALQANVDLSRHVSTRAADYEAHTGDLLLAMEPWQLAQLRRLTAGTDAQASLLGLWCQRSRPYLPDPYGRSDGCFRQVFAFVEEAVELIGRRLQEPQSLSRRSLAE